MPRSFVRFAVAVVLAFAIVEAQADVISTHCVEREVALDASHSIARLVQCGAAEADALLWHLDRIGQVDSRLDGLAERGNGGAGSVIYVMDTGVMASHSEFASLAGSRVHAGYDAASSVPVGHSDCASRNKATDPCYASFDELGAASHGTSVASIAAGANIGVASEAFLVSIRVMNERGLATTRTYLEGLDAIIGHAWRPDAPVFRTAVVNISGWVLERLRKSDRGEVVPYEEVAQKMRDMIAGVDASGRRDPDGKRFLFVVAANNVDGGCGPAGIIDRFPALLGAEVEGLITVGGMTERNTNWPGTCRGGVEVLAPAQSIFSATITGAHDYRGRRQGARSGTSFAAPIISGIAARLLSDRPDLTPAQLEAWITGTPSRVFDASETLADGRVAYISSIAPAVAPAVGSGESRAKLEP